MVLVDYIGIFFYMWQYFWPHTALSLSHTKYQHTLTTQTAIIDYSPNNTKQLEQSPPEHCEE
jgi:hypothetical protein